MQYHGNIVYWFLSKQHPTKIKHLQINENNEVLKISTSYMPLLSILAWTEVVTDQGGLLDRSLRALIVILGGYKEHFKGKYYGKCRTLLSGTNDDGKSFNGLWQMKALVNSINVWDDPWLSYGSIFNVFLQKSNWILLSTYIALDIYQTRSLIQVIIFIWHKMYFQMYSQMI